MRQSLALLVRDPGNTLSNVFIAFVGSVVLGVPFLSSSSRDFAWKPRKPGFPGKVELFPQW